MTHGLGTWFCFLKAPSAQYLHASACMWSFYLLSCALVSPCVLFVNIRATVVCAPLFWNPGMVLHVLKRLDPWCSELPLTEVNDVNEMAHHGAR